MNDLPDEIYLHIAAQFTHLDRNTDLANLALVSRRWRLVAQEWLLKEPRFKLANIDKYMWELGHRHHLLNHVRSLEIWSKSEGRVQRDENGMSVKEYTPVQAPLILRQERAEMMQKCVRIISYYARKKDHRDEWIAALRDDAVPALFGVLLCSLPGLKNLKLGNSWLLDFPIFSILVCGNATSQMFLPGSWRHGFLVGALIPLFPRLTCLEFPAEMTAMYFHSRATHLFDLRHFKALKELGVSMKSLSGFGPGPRAPPEPRNIFPKSLEVLRISEAGSLTANFLNNLCLAKKKPGCFPKLRRVEVYFMGGWKQIVRGSRLNMSPHPIFDTRVMFRDAGLELYLYFPALLLKTWDAGGTPWKLIKEEGALLWRELMCYDKAKGIFRLGEEVVRAYEAEWDADGDVNMRQFPLDTYAFWEE